MVLPNTWLEQLTTGYRWTEGPVWFADGQFLIFSDIPNDRMMRWVEGMGATVFRAPAGFSNGNTRDREGRLITCQHGYRSVTRTEYDGSITTLVHEHLGKRLNSPNDVVVKSDGTIWFTDPPYGISSDYEGHKSDQEQKGCYVYRFDPKRNLLSVVADDFVCPNGIAFSTDERRLFVSDTGATHREDGEHHIRVFDVVDESKLRGGAVFAEVSPGFADGFRIDTSDNLWTSCGDGVICYAPEGNAIGKIVAPEVISNVAFGGRERNRLFMTAKTSVYSIYVNARGALTP